MIKQALISVSDKTGIVKFARELVSLGITIISTGGTAKQLVEADIAVTEVADHTGFPEILDGRVKTLNPKIHAGILARRDLRAHQEALVRYDILPIDLVVVNLYPFTQTVAKDCCTLSDAIENIDIGGPAMLRSAAKNYCDVLVVCEPSDYEAVLAHIKNPSPCSDFSFKLAIKVFAHTARYDGAISNYLSGLGPEHNQASLGEYPQTLTLQYAKVQDLRYGENPHQHAAFYRDREAHAATFAHYHQIQGKELSFNNLADADAAWECLKNLSEFKQSACVIVKHANPCGVALGSSVLDAYSKAFQTDPTSAFGGIIAINTELDEPSAEKIAKQFVEVVIAPSYSSGALRIFAGKKNVRLLQIPYSPIVNSQDIKRIGGGILVQSQDTDVLDLSKLQVVTHAKPTPQQLDDLLFSWKVAQFVKSNAIVFCTSGMTLGVGAGQMSRVDSARIAVFKAQTVQLSLTGSVVASDAFFPFRDGLDVVAQAGATCVIQPGGSIRDDEVIAAANELKLVMVLTGVRHFRH